MSELLIDVLPGGELRFVWDDRLASFCGEGHASIRRVSRIEPDERGQWWVDLEPVCGPQLGPFTMRGDALKAEYEWLRASGY